MLANGAIVSNHSYGGSTVSSARKATYNNLANNNPNHLFVYAAGNSNQEVNANNPRFGCALEMPTQLCIAASTSSDTKASFSNYGTGMVHVFAPGQSILSTVLNGAYSSLSGTSMAAPHVAGLASLLMSMKVMNATETKSFIMNNVQVKSQYASYVNTSGLIDAYATIQAVAGKIDCRLNLKCSSRHKYVYLQASQFVLMYTMTPNVRLWQQGNIQSTIFAYDIILLGCLTTARNPVVGVD